MRPWVSCQDKLDLLDRMYAIAHTHLGKKDQTIYVSMRQEYLQRIEAVEKVRKRTSESLEDEKTAPDDQSEAQTKESPAAATESAELGPEDVVRLFVSCWDSQDFTTEYSLLSPEFHRAEKALLDEKEYTRQRKAKYSARLLKGQRGKYLETICGCEIRANRAVIECVETRQWHTSTASQRRRYYLRHYPEGWLIDYFENVLE